MRYRVSVMLFTLLLVMATLPAAAENIRVALYENAGTVSLRSAGGLICDGLPLQRCARALTLRADDTGGKTIRLKGRKGPVAVNGKAYRGTIELKRKKNGRFLVINELDLEDYLKGVVAAEVPSDWEMEALKAQSVAARTYAVYQKRNSGRRPYHILATVDSQMYLGKGSERERTTRALQETSGQVVLYRGAVIPAFYHSSCGGHTEDALMLWGIDAPYLKGVDCDCQQISKYGLWEKRFSRGAVVSALRRAGFRLQDVSGIEIGDLTPAGRVLNVVIRTDAGLTSVPADTLRSALGTSEVPSIFFEPELLDGEVVLSGRGMGHGVGLCQWGAKEIARQGKDYRTILRHYYPGTTIGTL
ncbi:MAG: SpoIID/LytB domain-containing protein [Nitrospirota bacterium]